MLFLAYITLKFKTKYSQKNMLKLDFPLFEQTPHLGLYEHRMGCVWTVLDVPDISWG